MEAIISIAFGFYSESKTVICYNATCVYYKLIVKFYRVIYHIICHDGTPTHTGIFLPIFFGVI